MKLKILFPDNLVSGLMTRQKFIPCLCKISYDFEIEFRDPLQEATGIVSGWDLESISERAPMLIGGDHTHYADGEISIMQVSENIYDILDLKMFYPDYGWCPVMENGHYAVPRDGLCNEE